MYNVCHGKKNHVLNIHCRTKVDDFYKGENNRVMTRTHGNDKWNKRNHQCTNGHARKSLISSIKSLKASRANGPIPVDHAVFTDIANYPKLLFIAYWKNVKAYEDWLKQKRVQSWWKGKELEENTGLFHEVAQFRERPS